MPPEKINQLPEVRRRVKSVREYRADSKRETTKELANFPALFGEIRQPKTRFVLVPCHSSETRRYIPLSYFEPSYVPNNSCVFMEDATLYHFGVLSSEMHMAWVRQVCGRLESRYRYSAKLVYNNYPWPVSTTDKLRAAVEAAAQAVLDARAKYTTSTLAQLYDPLGMPAPLLKAHQQLDRAVDRCYRPEPFDSDRQRVEYLFALYEKLTAPLVAAAKAKKRRLSTKVSGIQ